MWYNNDRRGDNFQKDGNSQSFNRKPFYGDGGGKGQQSGYDHSFHQDRRGHTQSPQENNQNQPIRGQTDRRSSGEQDGQMPDMVRQYLLKTLTESGKQRY